MGLGAAQAGAATALPGRQYQISHEVQRGAQRASRVVLGTSGLRACREGECVIALQRSLECCSPWDYKESDTTE